MMMPNMGMHPPPAGVYVNAGYPGGPIPMGPPGSGGGGAPTAFYAQQVPPTAFPLGGFHNVPMGDPNSDFEAGKNSVGPGNGFEFSDKSIRRAFIRKVYSILCVQLTVTMGFIALFLFHPTLSMWTRRNIGFFYAAMVLTIVIMVAMACCESKEN